MSWVRFSLKHPIPTMVFFLVAMVVGVASFTRLSVDLYPAMEFPLAVVSTQYEGAGPQEVESLVSRPIEEIMGTVAGVNTISSQNMEGQSLVILQFAWGTNMDQATLLVREKVDQVKNFLPDGAKAPAVFKIDPQALPVITLGLTGDLELNELLKVAENQIKPRLERIDGVASVGTQGGSDREIQVIVDPARLNAAGITMNQVAQSLQYENLNLPGGQVTEGATNLLVRTVGQFASVDEIRDLRIGAVRLGDVAEVLDTFAEPTAKAWIDERDAIGVSINKQSGANTVQVAELIKAELKKIEEDLPGGVRATILTDQSAFVRSSINSVGSSGMMGGLLAILILFLFLRHFRATLAVALAIPISVLITFGPLFFGGVTLNIMSLGGLTLGVGMMVDSAIVVLENIFRHKQMGKDVEQAALDGASEVTLSVAASILTTVAVFLPVVFITGLAQQYFRELALSVTYSLLTSMLVSLTLVPIMARALLADRPGAKPPSLGFQRFSDWVGVRLEGLNRYYGRLLDWSLAHKAATLIIGFSAFGLALLVISRMGTQFVPDQDTSQFRVAIEMPAGTRLTVTEQMTKEAAMAIGEIPEVETLFITVGSSGDEFSARAGSENEANIVGLLPKPGERKRDLFAIMDDVRSRIVIPGATVRVEVSGALSPGGAPVEVIIKGDDLNVLEALAGQVEAVVRQVPGTREVRSSVSEGLPEVQIKVDRARAATYGLSPSQVATAVQSAVRGQAVAKFRVGGDEYDIRLQATEEARKDLNALAQLPLATPLGQTIPLGQVATVVRQAGPTQIEREDQARVVRVNAQLHNRDLGSVMGEIKDKLGRLTLPSGYAIDYGGQDKEMEEAFSGLALALVFGVVLVYLVMAAQFESFVHPFVIIFSVPLSFVGAVVALVITGRSLDISGMIGMILLVGVVVNNAIVLVDYVNQLKRRGLETVAAVREAGPTRLRPVLMTTLTTLLGLLPLATGLAEGSEVQAPMATVVIGGLLLSTLLTLVVVPVLYALVDQGIERVKRRAGIGAQA